MKIGSYVQQKGGYRAFVPERFPPFEHLPLDAELASLLERATVSVGRLDGISELVPDLDFFTMMYVRKEAALSSQIEGTRATMADSVKAEIALRSGLPTDVDDIVRYIAATNAGLERLNNLPLSARLICEVHQILLGDGARSDTNATPGEVRTTQNWVDGTKPSDAKYVPPPPGIIRDCLSDLDLFLHRQDSMPKLIKAALAHAQFETIHPFADGNGRTGRLLITFFLCSAGVLGKPVLYLSEFFRKHRNSYFDSLQAYHDDGNVVRWTKFCLEGMAEVAEEAIVTMRNITAIRERDVARVATLGRSSAKGEKLLRHLFSLPIVTVRNVESATNLSRSNANLLVQKFVKVGILAPRDEAVEYGRVFIYDDYWKQFTQ